MKVTVIPIVIDALGSIPKGLVKRLQELEIKKQKEIIRLLISARILWKVQAT